MGRRILDAARTKLDAELLAKRIGLYDPLRLDLPAAATYCIGIEITMLPSTIHAHLQH